MRFRQWISPTYKNLYDVCLNQAPFYQNEVVKETRPDHNYCRPWIEDPTLPTALPRVQLFFNSNSTNDSNIDIDENPKSPIENVKKIYWTPTINAIIPETYECPQQQSEENLTQEQETFLEDVRELINETRIAGLCCESNNCNVVYWRLSIHRIVSKLHSLLSHHSNYTNLLDWLHETVCKTFDRISIGHYVDLFQILYDEYPDIRSLFIEKTISSSKTNLSSYVYNKLLQKPNDLTEEVIYSINLPSSPTPIVCLLIPGLLHGTHMERIQFWQRNLSQVAIVMLSAAVEKDNKSEQAQIQTAYEDIITKFNEIRQLYPNHHIMFLGWNVGCILALKAALVCSVSSIICMSPPFQALSEESKNDFTQINASILFITGEKQYSNQIDHYRQRLKSRNGLIELGQCDDKLFMSENGKYRFRLTQQLIDKLIMEEMLDFITILSSKPSRTQHEEIDEENKKKKPDRVFPITSPYIEDSEEPFIYMGLNSNDHTSTTLTIPPEHDPNSIFLNSILPTTTRKRKGSTLTNTSLENGRAPKTEPTKRGRKGTKNLPPLPPTDDKEWAPGPEKRPAKSTTKKQNKQTLLLPPAAPLPPLPPPPPPPPPRPPSPSLPTSTTSILNTLLQLPANQPKQRTNETNLIKTIHQPPSFVNTVLSSNPFH
ncbi:unnamed protein product [Rotaria socialis]|uniref:KAT8 regulatory NSL complex subunit 3 n=6 Tax=Rotaria socialis TaxID=392032 RepID=A0A817NDV9_9BILA|nr:unnamed protein product [Rotaria socialis]CAF3582741.1 unnamed protein product [Rotaria socialis]CAF4125268.1 unnamed protein product [Rotaria socialis]